MIAAVVDTNGLAAGFGTDDLILATAMSSQADYLVTGDKQLQDLGTYQGVTILSPRAFLDLLRTSQAQ